MNFESLVGRRFGGLVVTGFSHRQRNKLIWMCDCDCGGNTLARGDALKAGRRISCGSSSDRRANSGKFSHGLSGQRIYNIWARMHERCSDVRHPYFRHYGGKGINVCDEWASVQEFSAWADDSGYNDGLTLERIDNSLGYSPNNCTWVSAADQLRNRSTNVYYSVDGRVMCQAEWARECGITPGTIRNRIKRGIPLADSLGLPGANAFVVKARNEGQVEQATSYPKRLHEDNGN